MGRNRRYYKITDEGSKQLEDYQSEWIIYKEKIDKLMINSDDNRSENNE